MHGGIPGGRAIRGREAAGLRVTGDFAVYRTPALLTGAGNAKANTAALKLAIAAVRLEGGGTIRLPRGKFYFDATIAIDISAVTARFFNRVNLVGEGSHATELVFANLADEAIAVIGGGSFGVESHFRMEGIKLTGTLTSGSIGLSINIAAFVSLHDVVVEGFDYNLDATDFEQSEIDSCNFRWGIHGMRFNAAVSSTSPNSITLINTAIANNSIYGLQITNPNAFQMIGGSIQYNGTIGGGSGEFGAKLIDGGDGYATATFIGVAFEGNGGAGDLISDQASNPFILSLLGCGFARLDLTTVGYGTNNISLTGSAAVHLLKLSGSAFRSFGSYSPNAARPYINLGNTNAKAFDDGSNYYQSTTEDPFWADQAMHPRGMQIGAGITSAISGFRYRNTTDQNFYIGGPFTLASGISFGSINDANNSLQPMEFRASQISLSADLYRGTTKLLGTRSTGWGAPTGTATRSTFATGSVTLAQLAERVKALIDDLTTHGVIGA